MKRRLNILCIFIVIIVGYPVADYAFVFMDAAKAGFEKGLQAAKGTDEETRAELTRMKHLKYINLLPVYDNLLQDSVYNEKTGSYVPVLYSEISVNVDTNPSAAIFVTMSMAFLLNIAAGIAVIVLFISFIISINNSVIFNWKNVTKLRWLGVALIICFIAELIPYVLSYIELTDAFSMKGYKLYLAGGIRITTLILGIASFIFAEIFAMGLKMQEEQELTI